MQDHVSGPHDESTSEGSTSDISPARREFLKASAAASAALLAGCLSENGDAPQTTLRVVAPLSKFDHVVVAMFENRSSDSLLGYTYRPGEPPRNQTYNGVAGKEFRNPVPDYIKDGHADVATRVSPGTDADMQNPNPDPGEEYEHVNTEYRVIMDGFSPEQLPVINTLAKSFAVYDAWFCAVPTQTIPNRSFFHASSSSGFVVNEHYEKWLGNDAPTIVNRLHAAGIGWRIYYDEPQIVPLTALLHGSQLVPSFDKNFYTMTEFYQDVAEGTLPAYAFIEPRMLYNNNDYHPPAPISPTINIGGWSDVRTADQLVYDIYAAIKGTGTRPGSNATNTLLLLTFDEHGNCFDHVPPPAATAPEDPPVPGELGFAFDRLGVRVPAIAISAYTQENTIVNRPIHHAALIRTLCNKYNLPLLTERDRGAPDLSDAINLDTPRDPSTWPMPVPRPPALHPPGRLEDVRRTTSKERSWVGRSRVSDPLQAQRRFRKRSVKRKRYSERWSETRSSIPDPRSARRREISDFVKHVRTTFFVRRSIAQPDDSKSVSLVEAARPGVRLKRVEANRQCACTKRVPEQQRTDS